LLRGFAPRNDRRKMTRNDRGKVLAMTKEACPATVPTNY
jgi:hypothetical protein